jgi:hypothetical protein
LPKYRRANPKATKNAAGELTIGTPTDSLCTGWDGINPTSNTYAAQFWQLLDYNGDGRDDLLLAERPSFNPVTFWRVFLATSTGLGFDVNNPIVTPIPVTVHSGLASTPGNLQLGDLNGDGILDVVYPRQIGTTVQRYDLFARYLERQPSGQFAFSAEYRVDYEAGVPSYVACGDCLLRNLASTGKNLRDINGDGRGDLLITVGAGENPNRLIDQPEVFRNQKIWMSINSRNDTTARLTMKFLTGNGSDLNAADNAPQVTGEPADFNGDGLPDLLYCNKPNPSASNELCSTYLNTGLPGAKAFKLVGAAFDQRSDRRLLDINGDGRSDLVFRPGSDVSDGPYWVLYANSEGELPIVNQPMPGCTLVSCAAQAFEFGASFFVDLDGDANLDFLALQSPPNQNNNIRTATSAFSSQFAPRDVITQINNGYGASTQLDYLPLTNRDVYRRDFNSRNTLLYGRDSPVQDLLMPMYVVSRVTSSAPTVANVAGVSTLNYRYAGAKIQGGGRGFLGFREVVTFDGNYDGSGAQNCGPGQTSCHMASVSTYAQAFPYIGSPFQSMSYVIDGPFVTSACRGAGRGAGRGADNCSQLSAAFPTFNIAINRQIKFSGHAMACQAANGSTEQCPLAFGTAQCFAGAAPSVQMADAPPGSGVLGRMALSTGVPTHQFSLTGKPQGLFVYLLGSQDQSYELQGVAGNRTTAEVFSVNCYEDGRGNLTRNATETAGIPSELEPAGGEGYGKLRAMAVQNVYTDDIANWRLGRLTSSVVTHGVKDIGTPSFSTISRSTQFSYQTATSKLLNRESISVTASSGDPLSYAANTYYDFDALGNKTAAYTCSTDVSEALCRDPNNAANPLRFHPNNSSIRRFGRTQFDSDGRFAISTSGPFYDSTVAIKEWTERITGSILSRDEFGEVTQSEDANGVSMTMLRGFCWPHAARKTSAARAPSRRARASVWS